MKENCSPYKIVLPKKKKVGILLSIPHCGVQFPNDLKSSYNSEIIQKPDDTDWFLEKLYDFAPSLGITTIQAVYSRWVIDLNRTPENISLYNDGRIITSLCPTTNFLGEKLYLNTLLEPNKNEIDRRLKNYFQPYHQKINALLKELKKEFDKVILWDAHSIRRTVSTIQKEPFPDLILGNNDRKTAENSLIELTLKNLKTSGLAVNDNHPFKGGFITRSKGNVDSNIHALQLEMAKDLYMSNDELDYDNYKANEVKKWLQNTFKSLINYLNEGV